MGEDGARPKSRFRGWKAKAGLACVAALLCLPLAEIALRVAGVSHPVFHRADPICGLALAPGAAGWQTDEGRAWVKINSRGWRDVERSPTKPPGVYRVAVLGDSFVEALQVDLDSSFTRVLERELARAGGLAGGKVEVLNFGVSGYGTGQELLTLRHRVWEWQADLVLLAFLPGNDVSDNSRALKKVDYVPYFTLERGELRLDDGFLRTAEYRRRSGWTARVMGWAAGRFRLAQLANHARSVWRERRRSVERRPSGVVSGTDAATTAGGELGLTDKIYLEPADNAMRDAWAVTEALIARMGVECAERKAAFAVVTFTSGAQVSPDRAARERLARSLGAPDLLYAERRIEALGRREGFPVLSLATIFQAEAERTGTVFHGFGGGLGSGHWNERGHRLAGETVAGWLKSRDEKPDSKGR